MTTSNLMSLPSDIVWKRLALDEEMMWKAPPSYPAIIKYPPAWCPSITIFHANPDNEMVPDEYQNEIITYLKVVCSLTGTTAMKGNTNLSAWPASHPANKLVANNLTPYYGCYGAILEIDLEPYDVTGVLISEYPYFLDFQPKKREIFESVTKSGEFMSDSKNSLSVRKSATSTEGLEAATGIVTPTMPEYKGVFRDEFANVRSVDASREFREKVSHTTSLSQLYQQLNSYHLGTNRALFVIQPRPHISDPDYQTFISGPRRLEGIQEFFLVVIQPKSRPGLCVSAHLRTGHFGFGKIPGQPIGCKCKDKECEIPSQTYNHPRETLDLSNSVMYTGGLYGFDYSYGSGKEIGYGCEIDIDANKDKKLDWDDVKTEAKPTMLGPGWKLEIDMKKSKYPDLIESIYINVNAKGLQIESKIKETSSETGYKCGEFSADLTMYLKSKDTSSQQSKDKEKIDFFVRRKTVSACLDANGKIKLRPTKTAYQDWKLPLREGPFATIGKAQSMNQFSDQITEALLDLNDLVGELHGPGPVSNPMHTNFVMQMFQERLTEVDDGAWLETSVGDLTEVADEMKERLVEKGIETRAQLLEYSLESLQQMLGITDVKARDLYLNTWDFPSTEE